MVIGDVFSPLDIESFEVMRLKQHNNIAKVLLSAIAMIVMILDAKTAIEGAAEGISLCLQTVIPSLFPFFLLSSLLISSLASYPLYCLQPLGRLLHIPKGTETIFLVGLLGGYPIGARAVAQSYQSGQVSKDTAERMLAFCSNCGPAFIFGIGYTLFNSTKLCFLIWGIHILSAIIVGMLTPKCNQDRHIRQTYPKINLPEALKQAVYSIAIVCGWIVIFRVLLSFLDRWILWIFPMEVNSFFYGIMELSNGCCNLAEIPSIGMRMIFFCGFLGFGGLCVTMQTWSVIEVAGLNPIHYLAGKTAQGAISFLLALCTQALLPAQQRWQMILPPVILCCMICVAYYFLPRKNKKAVAFRFRMVYNKKKCT